MNGMGRMKIAEIAGIGKWEMNFGCASDVARQGLRGGVHYLPVEDLAAVFYGGRRSNE